MPRCSYCGSELPGLERVCPGCYEGNYAELSRPRSFLDSIRRFILNPPTRHARGDEDSAKARQPWWLMSCWILGGLGFDWDCAFEWFSTKHPLFSEPVLGRTVIISLCCAAVAFLLACVVRRARFREAPAMFFLVSSQVWFYLTTGWIVHPNRWR